MSRSRDSRRPVRRSFRPELIFRDDSGCIVHQTYRSLNAALAEGQALAAYGLDVFLRHAPGMRPVRCVA